ncbi:MAG: Ig-like domain-containing protein [Deltaproteobacteria bacterium]|nr:Ig-like domain-containing protein [Deltaproteobacteria bacterium]
MEAKNTHKPFDRLRVVLLAIMLTALLTGGCDEPKKAPDVNIDTSASGSGVEATTAFLALSGRAVHEVMDSGDPSDLPQYAGVPGARVYAYIGGGLKQATTNSDGFFQLGGIPWVADGLRENGALVDTTAWELNVYVDAPGYILDWSPGGIVDYFTVNLGELAGKTRNGGVIILGNVLLTETQLPLTVTSNLIHESPSLMTHHLAWGDSLDGAAADVYLKDGATNITLTFNYPIDTTYTGTTFVEMFDPLGAPVAYKGTWDAARKIFTINPDADLTGDNLDNTKHSIYIREIVRAWRPIGSYESIEELRDVAIHFNVLEDSKDAPLSNPALAIAPEMLGADDWFFDNDTLASSIAGQLLNGRLETWGWPATMDYSTLPLRWDAGNIAGAVGFELMCRHMGNNTIGEWTSVDTSGAWTDELTGMAYFELTADDCWDDLTAGSEAHIVLLSIDADGNKSKISAATPLVISDTYGPMVSGGGAGVTGIDNFPHIGTNSLTVHLAAAFSEKMDIRDPAATPVLTGYSGAGTFTPGPGSWTGLWDWQVENTVFSIIPPETTLTQAAYAGQAYIRVTDAAGFADNDRIVIGDEATQIWAPYRISQLDTLNDMLVLNINLTADHPAGSRIRLADGAQTNAGDFTARLATRAGEGDTTLTLEAGQGAMFYEGMNLEVYYVDDTPNPVHTSAGTVTVDSISGDTIALAPGATIGFNAEAGSMVRYHPLGEAPGIITLRGAATKSGPGQVLNDILLDDSDLSTTIAANLQTNPNNPGGNDFYANRIIVQSTAGFLPGDWVYIDATPHASSITQGMTDATTVVTVAAGHQFLPGDYVIIRQEDIELELDSQVTPPKSGDTTITASAAVQLVSGEVASLSSEAFASRLAFSAPVGTKTLSLESADGFAVGMTISIDDGNQTIQTRTLTAVDYASKTVSFTTALATFFAVDTVVDRPLWEENNIVIDALNLPGIALADVPTVPVGALTKSHPRTGVVLRVDRATEKADITAVNGDVITLANRTPVAPAVLTSYHHTPPIELLSALERRQICTVAACGVDGIEDEYTLELTANLKYAHHPGAAVRRHNTAIVKMDALPAIMVGDTVIMDNDGEPWTTGDRYVVTVEDIQTQENSIRISVPRSGILYNETLSLTFMGDAYEVIGGKDSSGNLQGEATGINGTVYSFTPRRGYLLNAATGTVK